jgi:uncharacterized protein
LIRVEVVYALPDEQRILELELPDGARIADALARAEVAPGFDQLDLATMPIGVYGRVVDRDHALADGDRVEIYRPLLIDPKEARRLRAKNQLG